MLIRDDRRHPRAEPPAMNRARFRLFALNSTPHYYAPDRVLVACPACGRSHFVTADGCPDEAGSAREAALVDGRKAA